MSLSIQPKMQRKEFGWSRGGMVSGMILKSAAAFKREEKEQQHAACDVTVRKVQEENFEK